MTTRIFLSVVINLTCDVTQRSIHRNTQFNLAFIVDGNTTTAVPVGSSNNVTLKVPNLTAGPHTVSLYSRRLNKVLSTASIEVIPDIPASASCILLLDSTNVVVNLMPITGSYACKETTNVCPFASSGIFMSRSSSQLVSCR